MSKGVHFTGGRLKGHCSRLAKAGQVDALVRLLQSVHHREARLAVYWALLNAYGEYLSGVRWGTGPGV